MIYARNSDNKYGFISLILRDLHLLFKQRMLPEKKERIKLDFHNIGNMKNCKSKLQEKCNFLRQHGKNPMQVQIVKIIRKSAEKYRGQSSPDSDMKNAVSWPETARVAIMQSPLNPAGGILNLIGATRGKLCEKSRPVSRRLSQNSFIPLRHIRKYVQWPPRRICLQEPLWSLVRPDPVDRLFSELAGRTLRAHRCFHRFRPERREFRTVFLPESFCTAFPARPADAGEIIVSIPNCLTLGCDGFPEIREFSFRFRTLHADAFR